jgi:hypothetical protein
MNWRADGFAAQRGPAVSSCGRAGKQAAPARLFRVYTRSARTLIKSINVCKPLALLGAHGVLWRTSRFFVSRPPPSAPPRSRRSAVSSSKTGRSAPSAPRCPPLLNPPSGVGRTGSCRLAALAQILLNSLVHLIAGAPVAPGTDP